MFDGETISHVLAAVLTREPELNAVPPRVRSLLSRCLEKDPRKRLRDIGDAMSLVGGAGGPTPGAETDAMASAPGRRWLGVGRMGRGRPAGGGAGDGGVVAALGRRSMPTCRWSGFRSSGLPTSTTGRPLRLPCRRTVCCSPTTERAPTVRRRLLVRTLATGEVREVQGSASAVPQRDSVFWSPDSRQLVRGSAAGGQVFDVPAGTARPLCGCRYVGGSWSRDGTILLGGFGVRDRESPASYRARALRSGSRRSMRRGRERDTFPVFLPDGRRFLFTRSTPGGSVATYLGSLDGDAPKRIGEGSFTGRCPGIGRPRDIPARDRRLGAGRAAVRPEHHDCQRSRRDGNCRGDRGVRIGQRCPGHECPRQPSTSDPDVVRPEGNLAWAGG